MIPNSDAPAMGWWEPVQYRLRHLPIHLALLHTGKILGFGGSGNDETNPTPYPAEIWDPHTGEVRSIDQPLEGDVFCSGHSFLSDGRLLVAGGTHMYDGKLMMFGFNIPPFRGLEQTYTFDPGAESWSRVQDMGTGRWYPTLVTLGDGRVVAMAGLMKHFPWAFLRRVEIYTDGRGWQPFDGAHRWLPLYPRLHLLPSGDIFYSGSFNTHYTFPFTLKAFPTGILHVQKAEWRTIGPPVRAQREEGASVLLPLTPPQYAPRVALIGGGTPGGTQAVPDTELIDLSEANPTWRTIQPMKYARYHVYTVLLPNRQLLVVGGRSGNTEHARRPDVGHPGGEHTQSAAAAEPEVPQDPLAVREAELFDPDTKAWTLMARMSVDRLYHSNALLLPDGRVMTAGSNPGRRVDELRIEIYHPPYLFKGPRPEIQSAPATISYGEDIEIRTAGTHAIDEVALIRPSATTHGLDTDQRYVGLGIRAAEPGRTLVRIPENAHLAPPGYYMLFVVRGGIPSEARFVRLFSEQDISQPAH
jgi:hypothetical protein